MLVGAFRRTLGRRPKTKGFENPFQINPTPCKNNSKSNPKQWGTIQEWIVPKIYQEKKKRIDKFWKNGFRKKKNGKNEKKLKNGLMGGRRWVEWPERGRRWDGGWLGGDGRQ
jgi:hypothetical protein